MRLLKKLFILILVAVLPLTALAYWPTALDEALPVSAAPDTVEGGAAAISFTDGSILVVYNKQYLGTFYQIIDRFGEMQFNSPPKLLPGFGVEGIYQMRIIPDDNGGAFVVGESFDPAVVGIFAQRLDSLGNRMWGDMGVMVFDQYFGGSPQACPDGTGGFIAGWYGEYNSDTDYLWAQRVNPDGNLLWGYPGAQVTTELWSITRMHIASDYEGGCFLVWEDNRQPGSYNDLFLQHVGADGAALWPEEPALMEAPWYNDIISDGSGGCIVEAANGSVVDHWRYDGDGNMIWHLDHLSWYGGYYNVEPVAGEPGFFYLGFYWDGYVWGQRMGVDGSTYWPTWPDELGCKFNTIGISSYFGGTADYNFSYPYYYAFWETEHPNDEMRLYTSKLDTSGNCMLLDGEEVFLHSRIDPIPFTELSVITLQDGGIVGLFKTGGVSPDIQDVWAKRVNPDGTLGGPLHLLVDLEVQNPPVMIPAQGGSFDFNVAIADTYDIASQFDAWVEVALPDGQTMEIAARENLTVHAFTTLTKEGLTQYVPGRAPAGEYRYTLYVGDHDVPDWAWAENSFTFTKAAGGDGPSLHDNWTLTGFFDDEAPVDPAVTVARTLDLTVSPNPFNPTTVFSYKMQVAGSVNLAVFDVQGRLVIELADGWRDAGVHEVTFNAAGLPSGIYLARLQSENSTQTQKIVLLK